MVRIFDRYRQAARPAALIVLLGGVLAGCGATLSGLPVIGVPEEARRTSKPQGEYLPVGQSQFVRSGKPMSDAQRAKEEADMTRDRTEAATKKRQQIEQSARR